MPAGKRTRPAFLCVVWWAGGVGERGLDQVGGTRQKEGRACAWDGVVQRSERAASRVE